MSKCSSKIQNLVDKGIEHVETGNLEKAIEYFQEVIELEPAYARARLQILDIHKQQGSHVMALLHGGMALAFATEPRTKCQIYCVTADAAAEASERHNDGQEADDAIVLYEHAIDADPTDPVPRWNMCEMLYKRDRMDQCKATFEGLIRCVSKSAGSHKQLVERVLVDAEHILPSEEPWLDYIRRLRAANTVLVSAGEHPGNANESIKSEQTRRAILAYTLAASIAAATMVVSQSAYPNMEYDDQVKVEEVGDSQNFSPEESRALDESGATSDDSVMITRVDYKPKDLKLHARVSYKPRDFA